MDKIELKYGEYFIKNNLTLVMAKEDISLTGTHYAIIKHEKTTGRGRDQYGRYKTVSTDTYFIQFESEEEMNDHMIGLSENIDDSYTFKTIKTGEIPEELRDTEKAIAQKI